MPNGQSEGGYISEIFRIFWVLSDEPWFPPTEPRSFRFNALFGVVVFLGGGDNTPSLIVMSRTESSCSSLSCPWKLTERLAASALCFLAFSLAARFSANSAALFSVSILFWDSAKDSETSKISSSASSSVGPPSPSFCSTSSSSNSSSLQDWASLSSAASVFSSKI